MEKRKRLSELLAENAKNGKYPMHMPGHKRDEDRVAKTPTAALFPFDVTEIEGFDNLHDAHGVIKEIEDEIAELYGTGHAHILINGSTCGILSAVRALTHGGDKILVCRASHKSVYHAIELCNLEPHYILTEQDMESGILGSITPESVEEALKNNSDIAAVVITSPSYEGVVSDVKGIAEVAHRYGAKLIVDGAHGAHRGLFGDAFGARDNCGYTEADCTILSLHKTLPSLTQTAIMLSNLDGWEEEELRRELGIFETSSPSYILMASIDDCIGMLSDALFDKWSRRVLDLRNSLENNLHNLSLVQHSTCFFDYDISKIVISTRGTDMTGIRLAHMLRDNNIEPEMISTDYVVLMTSPLDTEKGYSLLKTALHMADTIAKRQSTGAPAPLYSIPPKAFSPCRAHDIDKDSTAIVPLSEARDRVSLSYIWAYPPGIPIVTPGEIVTSDVIHAVGTLRDSGIDLPENVRVLITTPHNPRQTP